MSDIPIFIEADEREALMERPKRGRPTIVRDGTRPCADCKAVKQLDQFEIRTVGGKPYPMSVCLDCKTQRDYRVRKRLLAKARSE